jgi:hypothetical protein
MKIRTIAVTAAIVLSTTLGALAYESASGHFKAEFPNTPQEESKSTERGSEHWFTMREDNHSFLVIYYEPNKDVAAMSKAELMDAEQKGLVGKDKLLRSRDTKLNGHDERDLEMVSADGVAVGARVVIGDGVVYEVLSGCPGEKVDEVSGKFLDSFDLSQ